MHDTYDSVTTAGHLRIGLGQDGAAATHGLLPESSAPSTATKPILTEPATAASRPRADPLCKTDAAASKASKVADIEVGMRDSRGVPVQAIYSVKDEVYAIYEAEKIMVHFADDRGIADTQRGAIADLAGLRAGLEHLTSQLPCVEYYKVQMASALQLALDEKPEQSKEVMEQAVANAKTERASRGRVQYLLCGFATGLVFLGLFACGYWLTPFPIDRSDLWLAAIGGTIGAFFSLAMSIRSRTVALDLDRWTNVIDGVLRVLIGVVAGAALTLLLATGALPELKIQDAAITGRYASWEVVVIVGFIAGFLERLLPDLLEGRQGVAKATSPG
jgi:hypothetical protein